MLIFSSHNYQFLCIDWIRYVFLFSLVGKLFDPIILLHLANFFLVEFLPQLPTFFVKLNSCTSSSEQPGQLAIFQTHFEDKFQMADQNDTNFLSWLKDILIDVGKGQLYTFSSPKPTSELSVWAVLQKEIHIRLILEIPNF